MLTCSDCFFKITDASASLGLHLVVKRQHCHQNLHFALFNFQLMGLEVYWWLNSAGNTKQIWTLIKLQVNFVRTGVHDFITADLDFCVKKDKVNITDWFIQQKGFSCLIWSKSCLHTQAVQCWTEELEETWPWFQDVDLTSCSFLVINIWQMPLAVSSQLRNCWNILRKLESYIRAEGLNA